MQGILIMDKPAGFTSFDVDAKLRGILGTRKIGHAGTLDPMATGVLPVFVGRAAKAVDMLPNTDKTYEATMRLGVRTDTGDITGQVLETTKVPDALSAVEVSAVLEHFVGSGMQTPPMYSAVKVGGQPLYKLARQGKTVERRARAVMIYSLELLGRESESDYRIRIACSKGTYVRVLLEDIGRALGVPATMAALRRTAAAGFTQAQAVTFAQVEQAKAQGTLTQMLLGVETVFADLNAVQVDEKGASRLFNGAPVYRCTAANGRVRVFGPQGFLGTGRVEHGVLNIEKRFFEG